MTKAGWAKVGTGLIVGLLAACSRHHEESAAAPPTTTAGAHEVNPTPPVAPPPSAQNAPPAVPAAPVAPPTAPTAAVNGDHYLLNANVTHPPAVPGDVSLTVEVHASDGYHVNNLYPVALDLTPTNATSQTQLRRADVAQLSQEVASFRVPVHVTGSGASLRGTMRFAVCSAEQCVPHSESFAVAVP
jgi:hypothetical protein